MELKQIQKEHLQSILKLSNETLGKGYLNNLYLEKYIDSDNFIGFTVIKENKVIGFTLIDILTPIQLKNTVLTDKDWFYQIIKPCNKIALRKQTVIDPKFHNQKVGSKLIKHSIKESISISDIQISTVWKKKHSNTMNKILLKNGFYLYKEIINYWEEDSLIKKYNCPICGIPPCKCSTEVYIKKKH